jgi:hypothetical protein
MKQIIILFIIVAACFEGKAQELTVDTLIQFTPLNKIEFLLSDDFDFYIPRLNSEIYTDNGSVRLLSLYFLSSTARGDYFPLRAEAHLLDNYHRFYLEDSKIDPVKLVLGMAQAGAVGYLAYKHIKKYGLR